MPLTSLFTQHLGLPPRTQFTQHLGMPRSKMEAEGRAGPRRGFRDSGLGPGRLTVTSGLKATRPSCGEWMRERETEA